jgi:hypothetical protein
VPPWKLFNPALKKGGLMMPLKGLKITLKGPYLKTTPMTGIVFSFAAPCKMGSGFPMFFFFSFTEDPFLGLPL